MTRIRPSNLLSSLNGIALCAAMVILSPCLESYAVAAGVARIEAAEADLPLSGPSGQVAGPSLQSSPVSLSLTPGALTGSILAAPAAPGVVQMAAPAIPEAGYALPTPLAAVPQQP